MPTITIRQQQKTADGFSATVTFDNAVEFPISIVNPFTPEEEKRLEWYFEQWLRRPILDTVKADAAMRSVATYGETLFHQVFAANPDAFAEYSQFRSQLSLTQIEIVGDDPDFHALHWEALKDPRLPRPMAVDAVMLRKTFKPSAVPAQVNPSAMLNVLVVVARPDEEDDVGYRTISRPLFETIRNAKLPVNIELLRPGTFESLSHHLEEKGAGYYHIIHFDAHGMLCSFDALEKANEKRLPECYDGPVKLKSRYGRSDLVKYDGLKPFLVLEGDAKGQSDLVEATELADLLTGKQIPVCLLNACQSGKQVSNVESYRETSLGSHLMRAGMQMVVAMGYTVTVSAARILMEHLYRHLFEGKPFPQAIQLGRKELYNRKDRTSGFFRQMIKLEDWLLPVTYSNRPVQFHLQKPTPEEEEKLLEATDFQDIFPTLTYGFFGRDLEILKIEKALLRHNLLLLRGMGGTGKTTLLLHLQRWWQKTHFVQRVFYFGYDTSAWTLSRILHEIGKQIFDRFEQAKFQAMNQTAQVNKLVKIFRSERYALILDNLESITGQSLAIPNTLPPAEQELLRDFLAKLAGGKSYVVFGSRSEESWLQKTTFKDNIYHLRGLDPDSRSKLAEEILKKHVPQQEPKLRKDADFERLMKLLAGYPLAMEVILPNLKRQTPKEILAALDAADIQLDSGKGDKTESILKCVEYSHGNLSPDAQQLLLCLAPFTGFIFQSYIPEFVEQLKSQEPLQHFAFDKFNEAINEAIHWGLLEQMEIPGCLSIQPVFPYFLKTKLNQQDTAIREAIWEGFKLHYQGLVNLYVKWLNSQDPLERKWGQLSCKLEFENLYSALKACLEKQERVSIVFCLVQYFNLVRDGKRRNWLLEEVARELENFQTEGSSEICGLDYILVLGDLANCESESKNYSSASAKYLKVINFLEQTDQVPEDTKQGMIAGTYHNLALMARNMRKYEEARDYQKKALELLCKYGQYSEQARAYIELGVVEQEMGSLDKARQYFQQALEIQIEHCACFEQGSTFNNLGSVNVDLNNYVEAKEFYQQALGIYEEYNELYSQAEIFHNLGILVYELGEYEEAKQYLQQALDIQIEYEAYIDQANTYHQLGIVSQAFREYEQARLYYQQALHIYNENDEPHSQALTYCQLGLLAEELEDFSEAKTNFLKALGVFLEFKTLDYIARVFCNLVQLYQKSYDEEIRLIVAIFLKVVSEDKEIISDVAEIFGVTPEQVKEEFGV